MQRRDFKYLLAKPKYSLQDSVCVCAQVNIYTYFLKLQLEVL